MRINYKWVRKPGQKCRDSRQLEGEIRSMDGWKATVTPGSKFTECLGDCDCELVPTTEEKTRGMYKPKRGKKNLKPLIRAGGNITAKITTKPEEKRVVGATPKGTVIKIR